jgi:hypothetical protein
MKRVPRHIAQLYGGAHNIRMTARAEAKLLHYDLSRLRFGSAYFPGGTQQLDAIQRHIDKIRVAIGVKNWGR